MSLQLSVRKKRSPPPRIRPVDTKRQRITARPDEENTAESDSQSTVSNPSTPSSPESRHTSPAQSPSTAVSSESDSNKPWHNRIPFNPTQQQFKASLPIFRHGDIRHLTPVESKTQEELERLTFHDWLDYFLRLPDNANKRSKNLYTDQQYIDLLHQCTSSQNVAEQMSERSQGDRTWLYNQLKNGTYRRTEQSYKMSADQIDTGPVLVSFVEHTDGKLEAFRRRHPTARGGLTLGMMRRCVPVSQIEAAIKLCHAGPVGTGHVGQDNTFTNCNRMFDGIPRLLVREFVRRCGICQTKQPKKHKAKLTPLVSRQQWERVVMDLVDYGEARRSRGMRYLWHAQDHFSKYNFTAAIANKTAAEVGVWVEAMLKVTGPIQILQCDNGGEFMGRVNELCDEWGMPRPVNSAPYRPQTNGLIERSGGTLQRALDKWMQQERTNEWVDGLSRITYQVNCTVSRATRRTPHELVFGWRPRWDSTPLPHALDATTLLAVIGDEELPAAVTTVETLPEASPPTEQAANALIDMHERSVSLSESESGDEYFRRTLDVPRRTPDVLSSAPETLSTLDQDIADAASLALATAEGNSSPDELLSPFDPNDRDTAEYLNEEDVVDLRPQRIGRITAMMGNVLDSGPYKFFRRGTYGGGRCCLSSWVECSNSRNGEQCMHNMLAKKMCDGLRVSLKSWMLSLSDSRRTALQRILFHVGNSGRENRGEAEVRGDNAEQVCWDTLIHHLSSTTTDLGWEALAALSEFKQCNVLLFVQCHETTVYTSKTRQAISKWQEAVAAGRAEDEADRMSKKKPGGNWSDTRLITDYVLVPRRMKENWPFRVIFHRSQIVHTNTLDRNNQPTNTSAGGMGHYESVVAHTPREADGELGSEWEGEFDPNTPVHEHLKHIGTRLMAAQYNDVARVRMERDHNSQVEVPHYTRLSAVGLRRASLKSGKRGGYVGLDILPCIIVGIRIRLPLSSSSGQESTRAQHETFQLLSEHGVLEGTYRADQLVPITLDNFLALVALYDKFSAAQMLMPSVSGHEPITETDYSLISAEEAFRKEDRKKKPVAVDNSRRRDVVPRSAAVAAETSLANSLVDRNKAPSLHTLTSQPTVPPASSTRVPTILYIEKHNKAQTKFRVMWGEPTNDLQWETKRYLISHAEYRPVLEQYAEQAEIEL